MKFVDLFSGCGGIRQAFINAGFECAAYCEIDKTAVKLYKAYYDTEKEVYFDDATKINTADLPDFDILVGGFPCQSFSIAGKRQGFEDTRGTMFFEIARILHDKRPRYFLLENVKGLLNHDNRKTFITIIKTLTDFGYSVEWAVLNSRYFGIPQNRERVFIVGNLREKGCKKIFPLIIQNKKHFGSSKALLLYWKNSTEKWVIEEKKYTPTIKTQSDLCRQTLLIKDIPLTKGAKIGTFRTHNNCKGFRPVKDNISPTIQARARKDINGQPIVIIPVLTPERVKKRQNGKRFKNNNEPMYTLTAQDRHGIITAETRMDSGGGLLNAYCQALNTFRMFQASRVYGRNRIESKTNRYIRCTALQNGRQHSHNKCCA